MSPNDTMTRAMLMTVLARMDGQDVTGGSTWYEKGINFSILFHNPSSFLECLFIFVGVIEIK